MNFDTATLAALLEIIGINIILSGDNAVVIALACRSLPPRQRRLGVVLGAAGAVGLRGILALFVITILAIPFLKLLGGLLLLWVGVRLLTGLNDGSREIAAAAHLWAAVWTIAVADTALSLDNVIAIAAAAQDETVLLAAGLAISVPAVVFGAQFMIVLIDRMPFIVTLGAAMIGYVGGEVIVNDPAVMPLVDAYARWLHVVAPLLAAVLVLDVAWYMKPRPVAEPRSLSEGAAAPAALFGLRFLAVWLGRLVLSRAPLVVSFLAGLAGYEGADVALGDGRGGDVGWVPIQVLGPIAGALIAIGLAELLARVFRRLRDDTR